MPPPRVLVVCALALAAAGCIEHRAKVRNPAGPAHADQAILGPTIVDVFVSPDEVVVAGHAQPRDVPVDAWRRDESGELLRWHGRVRTPLPWWQRFPCDAVTGFWPTPLVCEGSVTVACAPVRPRDPDELAAAARRDGYARPASAAAPAPETR